MFSKAKYVIGEIQNKFSKNLVAVVFPEVVAHSYIAEKVFIDGSIVSAGFCHVDDDGTVKVYGDSVSLNTRARPGEDEVHIRMAIGL